MDQAQETKKSIFGLLHNQFTVFAVVIALSVAVVFGLWKLLTAERTYRELVIEMQSKTFGNKWIAAFELSKILANNKIPVDEYPWLLENLKRAYIETDDVRTKEFIVVAFSSIPHEMVVQPLFDAISFEQGNVRFHALMALAKLPKEIKVNPDQWIKLRPLLGHADPMLLQLSLFVVAHHAIAELNADVLTLLEHSDERVRHAAKIALIALAHNKAAEFIHEILTLDSVNAGSNREYIVQLKLNALKAMKSSKMTAPVAILKQMVESETELSVLNELRLLLNNLKN